MKKQVYPLIIGIFLVIMAGCSMKQTGTTTYIQRLGIDTMTVESIHRTPTSYNGKLLQRMPETQVATYEANLNKNGTVANMKVEWKTPSTNPKGPKPRSYSISFKGTKATIHINGDWKGKNIDTTYTMSVPKGTVPGFGQYPPTITLFQQVIHQAAMHKGKMPYTTKMIAPGSHRLVSIKLNHVSKDTLSMTAMFGYPYIAKVNNNNKIVWYSAYHSTVHTISKPAPNANMKEIADRFAKLDAEGKGMPIASPLDSTKASIDGANIKIVYSRPSVRGRKIWGGLVPYNKVWRTGANAATSFSTSKNLIIGGTKVPAGNYTLYSIYTPNSAKLIINSQTGQWGTVYHKKQDFARIPMKKVGISHQEKFLISIAKEKNGGMLELSWDQTRFEVPFKVQ